MTKIYTHTLIDVRLKKILSNHPNLEGAQLSSLFHINNGESCKWDGKLGYIDSELRFKVVENGEDYD